MKITLFAPLSGSPKGAYIEDLPFGDRVPLSGLRGHLESSKRAFPLWGTIHLLYHAPLLPDNRILVVSLSFTRDDAALIIAMVNGAPFPSEPMAAQAILSTSGNPVTFWLQVRRPVFYRDIEEWTLSSLPARLPLSPFPKGS